MEEDRKHPRREILIEYVLLKGINDSLESADGETAEYLRGLRVKVNLIPNNPQTRDRFAPPDEEQKVAFLRGMLYYGYQTQLRSVTNDKDRSWLHADSSAMLSKKSIDQIWIYSFLRLTSSSCRV